VAIAGGVSANSALRAAMLDAGQELGWEVFIPAMAYSTDNAAMIAMTGLFHFRENRFALQGDTAYARKSK
jgi:N6-L-threonylcarbamoyladenine synthase